MSTRRSDRVMTDNPASIPRIRRITKDDLFILLNKKEEEMLDEVKRTEFGFMLYLKERKYTQDDDEYQILEVLLEILGHVFLTKKQNLQAKLNRIIRMLKESQQFLFEDIPRVLNSCMAKKHNINLVQFMYNYMTILRTLLYKDFFPHDKILNEIFPTLENYMNRLQERNVANLHKVIECFKSLRMKVERFEDPTDLNEDDDDSEIAKFRSLSIVPRSNDIVNYECSNIPQNIIDAPYKSVDHFLSVYYRLTREDMLRSFRECVKNCIPSHNVNSRRTISDTTGNHYYEEVSVGYPPEYTHRGIIYKIKVSTSRKIDWSKKEVLLPGSLVFLTPDSCNSVVFATVLGNPVVESNKSKTCHLKIKLEDDLFQDTLSKDIHYAMIEPSAYFECYKHVLSGIKEFSELNFPLSDIIAYFDFSDPEPEYLHGREYCLHEKCDDSDDAVVPEEPCSCKVFNPLKDSDWPTSDDLKLDNQQYNAFKIALTRKVAVIQGPPGTGKTFLGVKAVCALLKNVERKPIVICCLTNHALDQFLERMLKYTKKVVRLGSQSKSKVLEPHFLRNMIYAIREYHENEQVQAFNDEILKNSFAIVKKMTKAVLLIKATRNTDDELCNIKLLSEIITSELNSYSKCLYEYLDESALNDIIDRKYKTQLCHASGTVRKSLSASVLEWLVCSHSSDLYDKCRNKFNEIRKKEINDSSYINDLWTLTEKKRFELFYYWRQKCLDIRKKNLEECIEKYRICMKEYKSNPVDPVELEILKSADIVGVTTTGACKFKALLRFTSPCILVIEEAAQVLESHIIASLVPSIQHLILIGDHEQLRPLPADNELSERYNLKVSMFERLFHNGAPSATLVEQHRMKPCIAELLVPKPYKEYTSFENVYAYEEIKGVESSVFFFEHCSSEDDNCGTSLSNDFEACMVVKFAKYLNCIPYPADKITILTTYALQVKKIHEYLIKERLDEIHVTTVDNFQGEENDIILLSFVRSNPSSIGFLKESNRVCVALSRARMGMFCFGNFKLFANRNDLWKDIVEKLCAKNMIGDTLSLKCPRHNINHSVKSANDISEFLNGGCSEECNFILPCKHLCSRKCHFDDFDHSKYLCRQPCEKMIDETSVCPYLCFQKCKKVKKNRVKLPCGHFSSKTDSKCFEEVQKILPCLHLVTIPCYIDIGQYQCKSLEKVTLDCGHTKSVYCFQKQEKKKLICTELKQEIGPCGHNVKVHCNNDFDERDFVSFCDKSCGILLDCAHPCDRLCRDCFDTGIHGFCREKCELILTCGHKCSGFCGSPCPPCKENCFLSCGHRRFCINTCLRQCVECEEPCLRKCKHTTCSKLCWEDCSVGPCTEKCPETLSCGHQCIGLCGDNCPSLCRVCNSEDFKNSDTNNCFYELECEHVIEINYLNKHINNCLLSFEWPCCPRCFTPIKNSTRYKKELKKAKQISIEICETSEENSMILYLVHCMYGKDYIIPAEFKEIHKKILQILKKKAPGGHTLFVLKNCIMLLKKLVDIASKLEYNYDEYLQGKFNILLKWIYRHLSEASYQQLRDLETSVTQLKDDVHKSSNTRQKYDYFCSI